MHDMAQDKIPVIRMPYVAMAGLTLVALVRLG